MQSQHTLTRKVLYDLVWSEPMTTIAKRFQLSDVALRKICINHHIPLPTAGHWMKIKFKKKIKRTVLPQNYEGNNIIMITPVSTYIKDAYKHLAAQKELQNKVQQEAYAYLQVPEKLIRPDKLTLATMDIMEGKLKWWEQHERKIDTVDVDVSKPLIKRVLMIVDTFIKAVRKRGHSIVFEHRKSYVQVGEERIRFFVRERSKIIHNSDKSVSYNQYLYEPTGMLYMKLEARFGITKEIKEGKEPFEQLLSKAIAAIELIATASKTKRKELEEQWAEQARQQKIREEIKERKNNEIRKFNLMSKNADRYDKAQKIRRYIDAVEQAAWTNNSMTEEIQDWIFWAKKKADWFDPVVMRIDDLLTQDDIA